VDFLESPEHHDLRDAIGAVTDKYGPAYFAEHASAHEPTTELWQELAEHGFIGINLPEEYGGGGAGMTELAIVCEETAAHGCPLLLPLVSSAISGELLTRYGSDEQRRDWLPRMVSRETEGVFAITEPNAGSNSHQLTTTAARNGGRLRTQRHQVLHFPRRGGRRPHRRCPHGARTPIALSGSHRCDRPGQTSAPGGDQPV
jgi:alkylation response protein AidB-like acyl-CoA dehydrogenase